MFNKTSIEDIKVLLEQILEELKFMNLPPEVKQEEWEYIKGEQQAELQEIRDRYKEKTQGKTPKPE